VKIWGIADTHFSGEQANAMTYWGDVWVGHTEQIIQNWRATVEPEDLVMIGGDITWSTRLSKALEDLQRIGRLPGRAKLIVKGNHDNWWGDNDSLRRVLPETVLALAGDAIRIDGQVFCGTTGWLAPNDPFFDNLDHASFERELKTLQSALESAVELDPRDGIHLLMHFPPFTTKGYQTPFFDLIMQYPVKTCTFGHFHLPEEWAILPQGRIHHVSFQLTATDYLCHQPVLIWQT
jgi:uncharacterized protein